MRYFNSANGLEKLIVFIKKFIQYLVFFILIGLCAH